MVGAVVVVVEDHGQSPGSLRGVEDGLEPVQLVILLEGREPQGGGLLEVQLVDQRRVRQVGVARPEGGDGIAGIGHGGKVSVLGAPVKLSLTRFGGQVRGSGTG